MSQYNKTVLTRAGLELAKRANAGQAKFGITRAVTSADDWSSKTTQDLEEVTTIPNIMQQGTIMDAEEVESSNSVIGVSLRFTNKDLNTGYQIRVIGLYVKEEGAKNEILYALTTAVTPEYMPGFGDKVLYRFNMQMYLVIGKAQAVNVIIDEGTAVTHGQFDKYKGEVTKSLEDILRTHRKDMSHVAKSASLNGGEKILPDSNGNIDLTVPNPDLSKYVNIDYLTELLKNKANVSDVPTKTDFIQGIKEAKDMAKSADNKAQSAVDNKANASDVYNKASVDNMLSNSYFRKQGMNQNGDLVEIRGNATRQSNGGYAFDIWSNDWTTSKLKDIINQVQTLNVFKNGAQKDSPDFDTLTTPGNFYITSPSSGKNAPSGSWGNLIVVPANNARLVQIYFSDNGDAPFYRMLTSGSWKAWKQVANKDDINSLWDFVNTKANAADVYTKKQIDDAMNTRDQNISARLPLAGGNMNLRSTINWNSGGINDRTGNLGGLVWNGGTDNAKIYGDQNGNDNLDLAIDLGDDSSNKVSFRTNGEEKAAIQSNGHFTGSVDWGNVWGRPQDQVDRINVITPLFRQIASSNNWNNIFGVGNPNNVLTSLRIDGNAPGQLLNDYSAGIGFGGADTKGVLSVAYQNHQARITGGNGNAPVWSEDIAWKSDINDLHNQIQQVRENEFEVQTFTDENAAIRWENQRLGKRLGIINK